MQQDETRPERVHFSQFKSNLYRELSSGPCRQIHSQSDNRNSQAVSREGRKESADLYIFRRDHKFTRESFDRSQKQVQQG